MAAITIKADDKSQKDFEELFLEAKRQDVTLTKSVFFGRLIDQVKNGVAGITGNDSVDMSKYVSLETHNEIYDNYIELHNIITNVMKLLEVGKEDIISQIKTIQQRAMMVPSEVQVPEPLAENEIRFSIPEPHLSLLQQTKERLSQKFSTDVTMRDILLDMFARYTIEMYNEWFYPFVIRPDEFKSITGYTQNELRLWLRKADQA